jgi:hypothetical protein
MGILPQADLADFSSFCPSFSYTFHGADCALLPMESLPFPSKSSFSNPLPPVLTTTQFFFTYVNILIDVSGLKMPIPVKLWHSHGEKTEQSPAKQNNCEFK